MASPEFPEPPPSLPETPREQVDEYISFLVSTKDEWTKVSIPRRIQLLEECAEATVRV